MPEFDLIRRLQEIISIPSGRYAAKCLVGIGDDGAVLDIPDHCELVVCTDTLVAGVHFPMETDPAAIGHKALAVNLSDLSARAPSEQIVMDTNLNFATNPQRQASEHI